MSTNEAYDRFYTEKGGKRFLVELVPDDCAEPPWVDEYPYDLVTDWLRPSDKKPGWRVLCADRGHCRFFDVQKAVKVARKERWGLHYYGGTVGEAAANTVERMFDYYRSWCDNVWCYVGVRVTLLKEDGTPDPEHTDSVYGIAWGYRDENETGDVADDMMNGILSVLDAK